MIWSFAEGGEGGGEVIFPDTSRTPKCWLGYTLVSSFSREISSKRTKLNGSLGGVVECSLSIFANRKYKKIVVGWLCFRHLNCVLHGNTSIFILVAPICIIAAEMRRIRSGAIAENLFWYTHLAVV